MWVCVGVWDFFKEGVRARIQVGYGSKMCGGNAQSRGVGKKGRCGSGTCGRKYPRESWGERRVGWGKQQGTG